MNNEEIQKVIEDTNIYDDSREDALRSMISDAFSRQMRSTILLVWAYFLPFLGLAIFSAVKFFKSEEVKDLIMFATIFVCCNVWTILIKLWAYHMVNRHGIKREVKRLEVRFAELSERLQRD